MTRPDPLTRLIEQLQRLPGIGANVYWISLVAKLRDLLRDDSEETVAA
jgi:recombinational DNA repair protein RecR